MADPREVVTRCLEASNARDVEGVMRCLSDDIEMNAPGGVHLAGKAAYRDQLEKSLATYPDAKVIIVAMYVDGNTVITELQETATQAGELQLATGEIAPPSGRS